MNVYEKLNKIQTELKAPKNQYNKFGKYNYRNCEDILEGLKPLLEELKAVVIITDDLVLIGERYYIKATAQFIDIEDSKSMPISVNAYAREALSQSGMQEAQLTGSTSTYSRKYALDGLFAIDDTKDADNDEPPKDNKQKTKNTEPSDKITDEQLIKAIIASGRTVKSVIDHYVKETGNTCSELKYMKYESKAKVYDFVLANPKEANHES